jgi:Cu(I)/Ag(I) efflux system membrane fusion protein
MNRSSWLRSWVWALAAAGVIVGALVVQDARHGWPFTRHHQITASRSEVSRTRTSDAATADRPSRAAVPLDSGQFERLGIQLEAARVERLTGASRHVAVVAADESRISHVHTRVSGWVEKLYVNTTGESVRAGQPVAAVFSQELFASQNEYLTALRQSREVGRSAVLEASRTRLGVLGLSAQEIDALERNASPRRLLTVVAPRNGIVLRRGVTVGTAIDPSTELMTIGDLSRVWVLAEVPESEALRIAPGASAELAFPSSGRASVAARVDFVYPTLSERTRTVRVRFSVENARADLRPGQYGTASFGATAREALTVARDAVVDTGETQHVFVATNDGTLQPRTVKLGARQSDRIEVLEGLTAGEVVVKAGVFLIDSESRLRASGTGASHVGHGSGAGAGTPPGEAQQPDSAAHAGHGR